MVIWVQLFQTELLDEIDTKSLARDIGKVGLLLIDIARTPKPNKSDGKWPLFVKKQLF